ncbi:hypothetical protein A9P82_03265 [Arachidicoccus ginsenosidimutans]|uniref:DUF72 domain-containing protein n=1 Tax=Arachidicoccus sp. BS20 TaxID=1850526 RepID=UPI0007F10493|nr:DUF72 domain-containing protein [Arachidicoccus sp. BS20]ANI88406.1 hypothetical protein A9P82_03265 [Arachidicoccus sp. BS20]
MEYGSVQEHELENIDFNLPEDCKENSIILNGKRNDSFKIHIGLPRWNNPEWKGKIYPTNAKDSELLSYYSANYNCIELNATWYKIPSLQNIHSWKNLVKQNENFLFCPKMIKDVTHTNSLPNNKNLSDYFIDTMRNFDNYLGAIFIQLNETFAPTRKNELFSYLKTLPNDIPFFLEVRHPQWFSDKNINKELLNFLEDNRIGIIITDTAGRRDAVHMSLTIPKTLIRFAGNSLHASDYARIDDWVERINFWMNNGTEEIYFFIHMPNEMLLPELTIYLIDKLNETCGLNIKRPQLINDTPQLSLF